MSDTDKQSALDILTDERFAEGDAAVAMRRAARSDLAALRAENAGQKETIRQTEDAAIQWMEECKRLRARVAGAEALETGIREAIVLTTYDPRAAHDRLHLALQQDAALRGKGTT